MKQKQNNFTPILNICMVVFSYYPADPRPRREAEALVNAGHSVNILCLQNKDERKKENINGVNIVRIPIRRNRGKKIRYIIEYGVFIIVSFLVLTIKHLRKNYRIIHIHNMPDILVFCSLIPKLSGSKIILDLHDPMPEVYQAKYNLAPTHPIIRTLIFLEKASIRFADLILTPNQSFLERFIERGCPKEKIKIIMNSPDPSIFSPVSHFGDREDKTSVEQNFKIMYHGTITERNGLHTALQALAELRSKIPTLSFEVYGEGDFVPQFLNLTKLLELDDIVSYHGHVPLEKISKAIESADLGLIPNEANAFTEINFPTRIFEYLSMGKAVIIPNTTGIRDYFDLDSAPFFNPGDVESLKISIYRLFKEPHLIQQYYYKGRNVYMKYSWETQSNLFVNYVNELYCSN